ncbi:UNKNOWN [Stylonychia lemnae]|uniref:SNRNP25 ubiquitin-like domain-containing protein n=1 Tax=Stylonychia lemnae TaxID=5949 RepID=A0A078A4Q8_STYLE|nr:UNKNOWN [Stylonychia lemnae]|eukprot:CDW75749.1 UNKNOWN [Stylonychia lemnae]
MHIQIIEKNQILLPDIKPDITIEQLENILAVEQSKQIYTVVIQKMDGQSQIIVKIPADKLTLSNLRRRIEQQFGGKERINWKYVWGSNALVFDNRYLLVSNMNFDLKLIGMKDQSMLRFKGLVRRRNKNGPIRLRENERDQYIIV